MKNNLKPISIIGISFFTILSTIITPLNVYAVDYDYYSANSVIFSDPTATECSSGGGSGGSVSVAVSKGVPEDWAKIFSAAAAKFNTNPNFIAALYMSENGNIWYPVTRTDWPGSNRGARGPMQFIPSTWSAYQQDGNGDGTKDINNVTDAVFAAAALSKSMKIDANTPLGNRDQPVSQVPSMVAGSISYNAGPGAMAGYRAKYGASMSLNTLRSFNEESADYVTNFYALISSDFSKGDHPSYGQPRQSTKGASTPSGSGSSTVSAGSTGSCSSSNGDLGYDGSKRPGDYTADTMFNGHVNYQQCDPVWKDTKIAKGTTTICHSACGPFSMANIIQNFGYNVDPSKIAIEAGNVGVTTANGSRAGNVVEHFAPKFNLRYEKLPAGDVSALKNALKNGAQVILAGKGGAPWIGSIGHIESLWSYNESKDTFSVSDPGNRSNSKDWPVSTVLASAYNYGGADRPDQLAYAVYKK